MVFRMLHDQVVDTDTITLIGNVEVAVSGGVAVARYPFTEDAYPITMFRGQKFTSTEQLVSELDAGVFV